MDRLRTPRLPITLASLALLAVPFGCGSESTTADVPPPPPVVVDAPPVPANAPAPIAAPGTLDQAVQQTAGELIHEHEVHHGTREARDEVRQAEGDVKKAAGDVEDEAKRKARELEVDARKSAEDALDRLLPAPK